MKKSPWKKVHEAQEEARTHSMAVFGSPLPEPFGRGSRRRPNISLVFDIPSRFLILDAGVFVCRVIEVITGSFRMIPFDFPGSFVSHSGFPILVLEVEARGRGGPGLEKLGLGRQVEDGLWLHATGAVFRHGFVSCLLFSRWCAGRKKAAGCWKIAEFVHGGNDKILDKIKIRRRNRRCLQE